MIDRSLRQNCFTVSWVVLGGIAWLLPLVLFVHSRLTNQLPANYDAQYHRGQGNQYVRNDDIGWRSYLGKNGRNDDDDDDVRWRNYQNDNCSWLFGCEYQDHAASQVPKWWIFSNSSAEISASLRAALCLIYIGSSCMFGVILVFGFKVAIRVHLLRSIKPIGKLVPILIIFGSFSLLTMLLIGCVGGMVNTSGREFVRRGWFGQIGVLLFSTAFCWTLFAVFFASLIHCQLSVADIFDVSLETLDDYELQDPNDMNQNKRTLSPAKTAVDIRKAPFCSSPTSSLAVRSAVEPMRAKSPPRRAKSPPRRTLQPINTEVEHMRAAESPPLNCKGTRSGSPSTARRGNLSPNNTKGEPLLKSIQQRRWEEMVKTQTDRLGRSRSSPVKLTSSDQSLI